MPNRAENALLLRNSDPTLKKNFPNFGGIYVDFLKYNLSFIELFVSISFPQFEKEIPSLVVCT